MIGESITRQRAGSTTSRYSDTVADWSDPDETTITGCSFSPSGTSEDHDGRDAVIQGPTLYTPPGADIEAADRVVVRGVTYEVEGEPADWRDPYSTRPVGLAVPLRVVTG